MAKLKKARGGRGAESLQEPPFWRRRALPISIGILLVVAVAAVGLVLASRGPAGAPSVGPSSPSFAPDFSLTTWEGKPWSVSRTNGQVRVLTWMLAPY